MLITTTEFMPPFDCYAALPAIQFKIHNGTREYKIQRTFELQIVDENKRGKSKSYSILRHDFLCISYKLRIPKFSWFRQSYVLFRFFEIFFSSVAWETRRFWIEKEKKECLTIDNFSVQTNCRRIMSKICDKRRKKTIFENWTRSVFSRKIWVNL